MTTYLTTRTFLERMNTKVFFFLLFFYQVLFIFQGVDLSDEGFYATFYQQIYNNPEATQYNFMFWFSGIVGGAFDYVFHGLGIWGMRLAGVLVTTSTIIVTYNLLKKYLNPGHLKLGLLMVLLFINNNLKEIHYNDLSALFNMLTILYLFTGLKENKPWKDIFSRLVCIPLHIYPFAQHIILRAWHWYILLWLSQEEQFQSSAGTGIDLWRWIYFYDRRAILGFMKTDRAPGYIYQFHKIAFQNGERWRGKFLWPDGADKKFPWHLYLLQLKYTLFILLCNSCGGYHCKVY